MTTLLDGFVSSSLRESFLASTLKCSRHNYEGYGLQALMITLEKEMPGFCVCFTSDPYTAYPSPGTPEYRAAYLHGCRRFDKRTLSATLTYQVAGGPDGSCSLSGTETCEYPGLNLVGSCGYLFDDRSFVGDGVTVIAASGNPWSNFLGACPFPGSPVVGPFGIIDHWEFSFGGGGWGITSVSSAPQPGYPDYGYGITSSEDRENEFDIAGATIECRDAILAEDILVLWQDLHNEDMTYDQSDLTIVPISDPPISLTTDGTTANTSGHTGALSRSYTDILGPIFPLLPCTFVNAIYVNSAPGLTDDGAGERGAGIVMYRTSVMFMDRYHYCMLEFGHQDEAGKIPVWVLTENAFAEGGDIVTLPMPRCAGFGWGVPVPGDSLAPYIHATGEVWMIVGQSASDWFTANTGGPYLPMTTPGPEVVPGSYPYVPPSNSDLSTDDLPLSTA